MSLEKYLAAFAKLKVNKQKGQISPHKPLLLLALLDLVDQGHIRAARFPLTPDLMSAYMDKWIECVPQKAPSRPNLHYPIYHLKNDGFWNLNTLPQKKIELSGDSPTSLKQLLETVDSIEIAPDLWKVILIPEARVKLASKVRSTFFQGVLIGDWESTQFHSAERILKIAHPLANQVFFRNARHQSFATWVLRLYNHTCAISGMSLTDRKSRHLLDAAHIQPHSQSKNNSLTNGIALTPTLHRAFDQGLISISEDYKVMVGQFEENDSAIWNLKTFQNRQLLLPHNSDWFPCQKLLAEHRSFHGFE